MSEVVAPTLSTYQDDSTFSYDKYKSEHKKRPYLNLNSNDKQELISAIIDYYSLNELVAHLEANPQFDKITLQFPDELISDSSYIVEYLQSKIKERQFWVLADTSYSSCCIDEVAAEHVQANYLIHFGDACLNEVEKLQCCYVFGKPKLDLNKLIEQFKKKFDKGDNVVIMSDAPHVHLLSTIKEKLPEYKNLVIADFTAPNSSKIIGFTPSEQLYIKFNRSLSIQTTSEYDLFHITIPESPRLLQLVTQFNNLTTYDPKTNELSSGPYPNLMKRYRSVYIARTAGTIGILINTLSLNNTKKLINIIQKRIKDAGKKSYLFVVGKPNVAKLANFESIDIWCVLGCDHEGIIIDQVNEFFKPIITPYELLLGLSDELQWSGKWITDYKSVIAEYENEVREEEEEQDDDDDESQPPEFDPVTGRYISTSRPLRNMNLTITNTAENSNENALVERFSNTLTIKNTVSTSAQHLQNRHWTGLGSDYQNDEDSEGALVEEGIKGIARDYHPDI
ncbi:unnamed protein product [Candida verbasci]|uniref:2-(3-amino-3-carboxypropyl)histidine synthase subunit 2 n=1 Tax=Candida verbasci TaxID=1227364 RepID=A0A9W4TY98_9ASCO|nr:unnamed protein product [Candida verbasci]